MRAQTLVIRPTTANAEVAGSWAIGIDGQGTSRESARRSVWTDVDTPTGQPGRKPGILALAADGKRQLIVRYYHARGPQVLIHYGDRCHLGRRQRVTDERRRVGRVVDDIDLLLVQLVHDSP